MEENNEHIDLFEKYLNGNLSQMEIEFFDKRMAEDADFAKEFEAHKNTIDIIKAFERRSLKKQFAAVGAGISDADLKSYEAKEVVINSKSPFDSKKWRITFWIMIASGIAMAATMIYALNNMPDIEEKFGLKENGKHIEEHCVYANTNRLYANDSLLKEYKQLHIINGGWEGHESYRTDTFNIVILGKDTVKLQERAGEEAAEKQVSLCYRKHGKYQFNYFRNTDMDSIMLYGMAKGSVKLYKIEDNMLFSYKEELYHLPETGKIAEPIKLKKTVQLNSVDIDSTNNIETTEVEGVNDFDESDVPVEELEVANDIEINNSTFNQIESEMVNVSPDILESSKEGVYDLNSVDNYPAFVGGKNTMYQHISNHIKLPEGQSVNGKVYSTFIVNKNGTLEDIKIVKGINTQYNAAVLKVIEEMPKWNAATLNGKKVDCKFVLPITFAKEEF